MKPDKCDKCGALKIAYSRLNMYRKENGRAYRTFEMAYYICGDCWIDWIHNGYNTIYGDLWFNGGDCEILNKFVLDFLGKLD